MILDVVYNHIGPGSEAIAAFGPYFTDRHETFWGDAIDYSQRGVREWAIQNARALDARLPDRRAAPRRGARDLRRLALHVLRELASERVPAAARDLEMETGRPAAARGVGPRREWLDDLHHELHVLLTGEHDGYYADYGSLAGLVRELDAPARRAPRRLRAEPRPGREPRARRPAAAGRAPRRARGRRSSRRARRSLFMGEEYDERAPFQFFTDHIDP